MSGPRSSILISTGFPVSSPWLLENLDANFRDYAVAILSTSVSKNSNAIQQQTNVLKEQTNQLEAMQDFSLKLKSGTETALVLDSTGNILVNNPTIVSDLIGRQTSSLTGSEIDRLIDFTKSLASSVEPVNLGSGTYVAVSVPVGQPPTERVLAAPLRLWNTDPSGIPINDIEPYVCYAFRAPNGTISYRICDRNKVNLPIAIVNSLSVPDKNLVFDAYRVNTGSASSPVFKTFVPQNISNAFPTSQTPETLFRNVFTGELRLVGPSQPNISYTSAEGFVIPSSQSDINFWFGQAAAKRLQAANKQFATDEINIPAPDTFQWKYNGFEGGGFADYPPQKGLRTNVSLAVGSIVEDSVSANAGTPKLYLITGRVGGVNQFVEVLKVDSEFTMKLSSDDLTSVRGQYAERTSRLTQRTAEQQSFLNSLVQKFNIFSDVVTNVLKVLSDNESRLSNFR